MFKQSVVLGLVTVATWLAGSGPAAGADPAPGSVGKKVAAFALTDPRDQSRVSLADLKDKKAVVVVFLGTECPINNAFLPTLAELHKQYVPQGVQVLGINSNVQDTAERVAAHARKNALPFPVLKDPGNKVADQFGARRTPEAFVLDAAGVIVYQGRIDDQFGLGYQQPRPSRRDLALALDDVLAGKAVSQAQTPVAGCLIGRALEFKADGAVTFTRQVSRILQKNCQECHRPGHIGPMALLTYEDATAWSAMIHEVVSDRRMPPWHADPRHGSFSNDRSLSQQERDTLLSWIDQGCPKGDPKEMPAPREFVDGWRIGKPDVVFSMPEEFDVPASVDGNGVPYKYFTVDPGFKEDRWVERAEAKPGAPEVVHHIIVFVAPPSTGAQAAAGGRGGSRLLVGTAPGDMPLILEPGLAKKVPAGAKLVFQMHYTPNGKAQKDRSSVGLIFAKEPPKRQVLTVPVANRMFKIPPGDDSHKVESSFTFPEDGHLISFMPHMHLRGKDFLYEAIFPDGKTQTLLAIPRYDFNWQSVYRLAAPVPVPKGTRIHCVAHFDNSTKNRNNPDPTKTVTWGDQTWEEMMIGWTDFVFDRPPQ
jgi:peroxiredoxin